MNREKDVFFNRAEIKSGERMSCENCFEQVVFHLRDKDHDFSMGLITVLKCIEFAVKTGDLPKLPASWCRDVGSVYGLLFDKDVMYLD
ncbi:MAG: hypothetical protein LUE14_08650, partial [Clostridiales bacterium]|nr:hypothetical protein [Clostridiales bacterium]